MNFILSALIFIISAFTTIVATPLVPAVPDIQAGDTLGSVVPLAPANFETSLASPISTSATTMTLVANVIRGGSTFAGYSCFTIDEGSAQAEYVCGTISGTTVSGMTRGIDPLTGTTTVTALKFAHRRGASVKITDAPILSLIARILRGEDTLDGSITYTSQPTTATTSNTLTTAGWVNSNYGDLFNGNTWTGDQSLAGALWGSSTAQFTGTTTGYAGFLTSVSGQCNAGSVNTQLCDKAYIDGVAVAGASDSNETTKGIVEEATLTEVLTGVATGGTGANLFVAPDKLANAISANGTTTIGMSGVATTTFTITAGQSYVVFVGFGCSYVAANGRDAYGYLYVDNKLVRQLYGMGSEGDNQGSSMPFFFTYASSSPNETTVDILPTASCTIESPFIDWIILP